MGWETALVWLAAGVSGFLLFCLPKVLEVRSGNQVKIAEANARIEEARLERRRLDIEHEQWCTEHEKPRVQS